LSAVSAQKWGRIKEEVKKKRDFGVAAADAVAMSKMGIVGIIFTHRFK